MAFEYSTFNKPLYEEEKSDPKRVIIISCEGRNTEPEYFETIKQKLADEIYDLVEVHIVPKDDNNSEPQDIVCNLDEYILDKYDYKSEYDEMWVVWDREKVPERKKKILEILPECKEKNYHIALTNPAFEFWLLLHIADISTYENDILFANDWVTPSKNKRFLEKELLTLLYSNGKYSKKKGMFNQNIVSKDNIKKALTQEKLFENELEEIIDNLGSNIGNLIKKIVDI